MIVRMILLFLFLTNVHWFLEECDLISFLTAIFVLFALLILVKGE